MDRFLKCAHSDLDVKISLDLQVCLYRHINGVEIFLYYPTPQKKKPKKQTIWLVLRNEAPHLNMHLSECVFLFIHLCTYIIL